MTHSPDPFKIALEFTLKWEGGAGHPQDLAGAVNRGISQATYDTYRRNEGLSERSVSQLTEAEVEEIYYQYYWKPSKADLMCLPLSVVHFDTAVNFNIRGSIEFLQEALGGLSVDGDFGSNTQAALDRQNNLETAKRYCQGRIAYRHQRISANASQEIFLDGWLRRDKDLLEYIQQLDPQRVEAPIPVKAQSDRVLEKLQQAIALLQEVVETLQTPR